MKVDRVATPLTEGQISEVLTRAYRRVFERDIDARCLSVAWAHVAHEHARGKALWCWNIGNITTTDRAGVPFYELTTDEQVRPGEWQRMTLRYRAHDTPDAGAAAYWELLRDRYTSALVAMEKGDASLTSKALKAGRYYTANEPPYTAGLMSLAAEWWHRWGEVVPAPDTLRDAADIGSNASLQNDVLRNVTDPDAEDLPTLDISPPPDRGNRF